MGEMRKASKLQEFMGNSPSVLSAAFSTGARMVATGGSDHRVLVSPCRETGVSSTVLLGHQAPVTAVAFGGSNSPDIVVGGTTTGQLRVWDVRESQEVRKYLQGAHRSDVTAIDYHPFGQFFVSSSADGNIKVWDLQKKGCLQTYKHQEGRDSGVACVRTVRFSPDGRMVASGNEDGSVNIWDLTAGKRAKRIVHHSSPITSVEFHPQELIVTCGCAGGEVSYWDMEGWSLLSEVESQRQPVRRLAFSSCGSALLSATDAGLDVWDWPRDGRGGRCRRLDRVALTWNGVSALAPHGAEAGRAELLATSFVKSFVTVYVVNLSMLSPFQKGGPPARGTAQSAEWPPRSVMDAVQQQPAADMRGRRGTTPPPPQPGGRPRYHTDAPRPEPSAPAPPKLISPGPAAVAAPAAPDPRGGGVPRRAVPPPAAAPVVPGALFPAPEPVHPPAVLHPHREPELAVVQPHRPPEPAAVQPHRPPEPAARARDLAAVREEPRGALAAVKAVSETRQALDEGAMVRQLLMARRTHLAVVRHLWTTGEAPLAAEHLIAANPDPTLWADVLARLGVQALKRTLTAPVCAPLLSAALSLLQERCEEHVKAAVEGVRVMHSVLSGPMTRALQGRQDDAARAEHHRQCAAAFAACRERLRSLSVTAGIAEGLREKCSAVSRELQSLPAVR